MPSKSLIVFTWGGLGNRIRALLGGLALARLQGRSFSYVWKTGDGFDAQLTDLWEFPYPRVSGFLDRVARRLGVRFYDEKLSDLDAVGKERRVRIYTIHEMRHPLLKQKWREEFRALSPSPEVQRRVYETRRHGLDSAPYVGVMIRAHKHSHAITLEHSPVEWYLERMQEIVDRFPAMNFFLSTDSPEAQKIVQERFGNVVVQDDKGEFNSPTGVQAAVADLYLLASATFVLEPYWSSFTLMARALADDRVCFVHAKSEQGLADARFDLPPPIDPLRPSVRA